MPLLIVNLLLLFSLDAYARLSQREPSAAPLQQVKLTGAEACSRLY